MNEIKLLMETFNNLDEDDQTMIHDIIKGFRLCKLNAGYGQPLNYETALCLLARFSYISGEALKLPDIQI